MSLSANWDNEAYVSAHLVSEIFENLMPRRNKLITWIPEYRIPNTNRKVDFYVEDRTRNLELIIEVKSARNHIDGAARFQLGQYLRHSGARYGLLIDPFTIEIHELLDGQIKLKTNYSITDPTDVESAVLFLDHFLESIKMRTIAIHSSKGGVGKTTLTVNIAYELARMGNRVLVVDLDNQANASLTLGVNKAEEFEKARTIEQYKVLLNFFEERNEALTFLNCSSANPELTKLKECIYPAMSGFSTEAFSRGKINVLPASHKTQPVNLFPSPFAHAFLNKGLQKLKGDYDYVIIDTSPSSNLITWNGLNAAQYVIIPSQMEYLSAFGIKNLLQSTLQEFQEASNNLRSIPLGIIPTMVENTNLNQTIRRFIEEWIPNVPFLTEIKSYTDIGRASHGRKPMSIYADGRRNANAQIAAQQFIDLTIEIINRIDLLEKN
jgi:chromosome partitioning protein